MELRVQTVATLVYILQNDLNTFQTLTTIQNISKMTPVINMTMCHIYVMDGAWRDQPHTPDGSPMQ